MKKKIQISSIVTMLCLCIGTIIEGLEPNVASTVALSSYRTWITIISYIGVYVIVLWLVSNNSVVKIILTLVNLFAVVISFIFAVSGFTTYHGFVAILLAIIGIVGVISGIYAVFANNKFESEHKKHTEE